MHSEYSRFTHALMTAVFAAAVTASPVLAAPQHLVTPGQIQQSTLDASQARQRNIENIRHLLSLPQAQKAFQQTRVNPQQVKNAVSGLSDEELAQLSQRATKAQRDFAAGAISNKTLIIVIAGIILLIVLVIVA